MPRHSTFALTGLLLLATSVTAFAQSGPPPGFLSDERVAEGREFARNLCATCHLEPKPELFSRETWQIGVFPWMAYILGFAPELFQGNPEHPAIQRSGAVLTQPPMSGDDFGKIFAYYYKNAPVDPPPQPPRPALQRGLPGFRPKILTYRQREPMALSVRFDPTSKNLLVGDGLSHTLDRVKPDGTTLQSAAIGRFPVGIEPTEEGVYVTCIGDFFPSERATGKIVRLARKDGRLEPATTVLDNLHRPAHAQSADLNGDGARDWLVAMFGYYTGKLAWFEGQADGTFAEHELYPKPGAVRTEIRDLDGDGDPDIAALVASAIEGFFLFLNDGRGNFEQRLAFMRQPAFGHTWFELVDMDADGDLDILTANGDSGDFPSPPRSFHGVRIYLNDGKLGFTERWFFPLHGATKAVARDFDGDGDLDIAATAYYPNFASAPEEGFVYLRNDGNWNFVPHTCEQAKAGRWIAMEPADVDGDGDIDLVLGSVRRGAGRTAYVPEELNRRWLSEGVSLMLLENTTTQPR